MKALSVFLFLCLAMNTNAQSLDSLRWKNRVAILTGTEKEIERTLKLYSDTAGIKERKLALFTRKGDFLILRNAAKNLQVKTPAFINSNSNFYLVGLDGRLKFKSESHIDQNQLFGLIDSMPMRANEIRRKNE